MDNQLVHSFSDTKSAQKFQNHFHPNYNTFQKRIHFIKNGGIISQEELQPNSSSTERKYSNGEHCHSMVSEDSMDNSARKRLIIASVLCLTFMIAEIVGGSIANSLAIMTDAAHLLSDFASFLISLFAIYLASRPATKRMSFGWHRAEVVGALVSVLLIWIVTGILVYIAVNRVITPEFDINSDIMLITSGIGVIVNVIMACSLHPHSHSHDSNHSHDDNDHDDLIHSNIVDIANHDDDIDVESGDGKKALLAEVRVTSSIDPSKKRPKTNINVRAAFIHVIGDLFQSIGVLIAAFIIYFKPEWKLADPICTFLFSVLVLLTTFNILRDTMNVLMEGTPRSLDFDKVQQALLGLNGVCVLHNLRIWSLTMDKVALSVHLAIEPTKDVQEVLRDATKLLLNKFNIADVTIQVEIYVAKMDDCDKCKGPDN